MPAPRSIARCVFALLIIGSVSPRPGAAENRSAFVPDYLRLQYAGQAGLFNLGAGYSWWDGKMETGLGYGYVPAFVADRNVHILSQRNSLSLLRFRTGAGISLEPMVAGLATQFSIGDKYEVLLPDAQRDYYWPDGVYFWFFSGARIGYKLARPGTITGLAAQVEVGTVNQYWSAAAANRTVDLGDILSLAISAHFYL